jgi:protein-disulfide isomerase
MCPFCRDLANALRNYLPASGDQVRILYKHFPLDMTCNAQVGRTVHHGACELAKGGVCAAESGKFWEYHDQVFARTWETATATREDVLKVGDAVGLDRGRLNACIDSAATRGRLAKDVEEGLRIGVGSTPTIVINGRKLSSVNLFFLALEEERKRLNLSPPAGTSAPQKK